jgi:hypothetical protein
MRHHNFSRWDDKAFQEHRRRNRIFFGITIALLGVVFLLKTMGVLSWFDLEFSWPVVLIVVGIMIGVKNNFRRNAWWILILIGIANLVPQFTIMGKPSSHYVWPALAIVGGLMIAFRPRRDPACYPRRGVESTITSESTLNIDVTFGGKKEVVTSKDFKGGLVSVTFAGCEINLNQADFQDSSVVLDCRVSFGSMEIIVPSHWDVQNEINPSFGNIEDDRTIQTAIAGENKKTLILRGNCSFGSIEIKSY